MLFFIEAAAYPTKQWGQSNIEVAIKFGRNRARDLFGGQVTTAVFGSNSFSSSLSFKGSHKKL
jgi:hypothetical protein